MKIVICDDDLSRIDRWKAKIEGLDSTHEVVSLTAIPLVEALEDLFARNGSTDKADRASEIDEADVLVIDSNLTPDDETLKSLGADAETVTDSLRGQVGDNVAYAARTLTNAKVIVVVNQEFSDRTFDLTMRRFSASIGDLYVSAPDLTDDQLWKPSAPKGQYRPWSWPALGASPRRMTLALEVAATLDSEVVSTLGIEPDALSPEQLDVFGDAEPAAATFRNMATSVLGLRPNDYEAADALLVRAASGALLHWIDRFLVAPQNWVADIAHLLPRFPSVFPVSADLDTWTELAHVSDPSFLPSDLQEAMAPISAYTDRPVFDVARIRDLSRSRPVEREYPDAVFAEDTSRFVELDSATEYLSALPGNNARRFVEEIKSVRYIPRVRRL